MVSKELYSHSDDCEEVSISMCLLQGNEAMPIPILHDTLLQDMHREGKRPEALVEGLCGTSADREGLEGICFSMCLLQGEVVGGGCCAMHGDLQHGFWSLPS